LALLIVLISVHPFSPQLQAGAMEVTVLDVGQGDAIFVASPDGRTMLIDGGGSTGQQSVGGMRTSLDVGEQVVSSFLWSRGVKQIDVVALTHAHQDHLDGLFAILRNFRVGEMWIGRDTKRESFRSLLALAAARQTRILHRRRGETFRLGEVSGRVLWPDDSSEAVDASNNDSLVLRLEWNGRAVMLPGDIEKPVEDSIIRAGDALRADFLKVPHHGSRTSTSANLIAAVDPRVAVMSFGEANPFGHPHRELLERLHRPGLVLLRTDRDGAVTVLVEENGLRVKSFAGTQ
jgi:competence protein ComEC